MGVAAILVLAAGFVYLVWRASEPGPPVASAQPEPVASPAPTAVAAQPQLQVAPVPPAEPERPVVEMATDRNPRNDVQRPADRRADLLQEERSAKLESAMDLLNRRTALRKEEMQANGEVRPSAPVKRTSKR